MGSKARPRGKKGCQRPIFRRHDEISKRESGMSVSGLIEGFRLTRMQFARDRVIGDSQVCADEAQVVAVEIIDDAGRVGLGFAQSLFVPLPSSEEIERVFRIEAWP